MVTAIHTLIYSDDPAATRAFLRDVLGWPYAEDTGTRAELEAKGATFLGPVDDEGWGLVTSMAVPGADPVMLYEPRHPTAYDL